MNYFGKGWWNESFRHSLAAKGIRSSMFSKISVAEKIFPTENAKWSEAFERIKREHYVVEKPLNLIRADVNDILRKRNLSDNDILKLYDLYMDYFDLTTKEDIVPEEELRDEQGNIIPTMDIRLRKNMLGDLARTQLEQVIREHERYHNEIEVKIVDDVKARIDDLMVKLANEPDVKSRGKILFADLSALAADLDATRREYGLYDQGVVDMQLRRLLAVHKDITPERIMSLAKEKGKSFEDMKETEPLRGFGALEKTDLEAIEKERREAKLGFWQSLTSGQKAELEAVYGPEIVRTGKEWYAERERIKQKYGVDIEELLAGREWVQPKEKGAPLIALETGEKVPAYPHLERQRMRKELQEKGLTLVPYSEEAEAFRKQFGLRVPELKMKKEAKVTLAPGYEPTSDKEWREAAERFAKERTTEELKYVPGTVFAKMTPEVAERIRVTPEWQKEYEERLKRIGPFEGWEAPAPLEVPKIARFEQEARVVRVLKEPLTGKVHYIPQSRTEMKRFYPWWETVRRGRELPMKDIFTGAELPPGREKRGTLMPLREEGERWEEYE